jgi:hypothetical protein
VNIHTSWSNVGVWIITVSSVSVVVNDKDRKKLPVGNSTPLKYRETSLLVMSFGGISDSMLSRSGGVSDASSISGPSTSLDSKMFAGSVWVAWSK